MAWWHNRPGNGLGETGASEIAHGLGTLRLNRIISVAKTSLTLTGKRFVFVDGNDVFVLETELSIGTAGKSVVNDHSQDAALLSTTITGGTVVLEGSQDVVKATLSTTGGAVVTDHDQSVAEGSASITGAAQAWDHGWDQGGVSLTITGGSIVRNETYDVVKTTLTITGKDFEIAGSGRSGWYRLQLAKQVGYVHTNFIRADANKVIQKYLKEKAAKDQQEKNEQLARALEAQREEIAGLERKVALLESKKQSEKTAYQLEKTRLDLERLELKNAQLSYYLLLMEEDEIILAAVA